MSAICLQSLIFVHAILVAFCEYLFLKIERLMVTFSKISFSFVYLLLNFFFFTANWKKVLQTLFEGNSEKVVRSRV